MSPVEDLKAKGNQAFSAGQHEEAIKYFSEAILQDPSSHILYSNRSASYASLKKFDEALQDANKTVELNSTWAKGYSRQGAALFGRGDLEGAKDAFKRGLAIEPTNAQLQKGLEQVESALLNENTANPFGNFNFVEKISANPKLRHLLSQPDFMAKLQRLQTNPDNMGELFKDPRMMSVMSELFGISMSEGPSPMEHEESSHQHGPNCHHDHPAMETKSDQPKESSTKHSAKTTSPEKSEAQKEKELGNEAFKKKDHLVALQHYDKAWELDPTDVTYLTNKATVLFEMNRLDECIQVSNEAIEKGRELRTDYQIIARAYSRIGSAHLKLDQLDEAIHAFNKSLAECRSPEVLTKLRDTEKLKSQRLSESYYNPELGEQAKNEGNELFRSGNFADALKHYSEAIKRNPKEARYYSNRAACYAKLMSYHEAIKDCDEAIKLDPSFIKAYLRKATVWFALKEYQRAMTICQDAMEKDEKNQHKIELEDQIRKCLIAIQDQQSSLTEEEISQKAMQDPEIQEIMSDTAMRAILQQMGTDQKAAMEHMKNPVIARKIRKLMAAGIVKMGGTR